MANQTYKNWRLQADANQVLWIYFSKENSSVNTINHAVMTELATIVDMLLNNSPYKGLVIASDKKSGFIAGADIAQFNQFKDISSAVNALTEGHNIFNKLEAVGKYIPTIALIDGFCLGGGTELALACRYRIAEESAKTRIALPEVMLGIHPGWGGTVRLPRLIGGLHAMDLILSGRSLSGKAAEKMGLVDVAVPRRQLLHAVNYYLQNQPPVHRPHFLQSLTNKTIARQVIAWGIKKYQLKKKANPLHYPAPYVALSNWEHVGVEDTKLAYEREARTCGSLFFSETSENLVRDFFLQERLKGLAKEIDFTPRHVHVIGAGTMGGDIAAWCALRGFTVTLQDLEPRFIAPAIARANKLYQSKLKEAYLVQQVMDRLIPDPNGYGIKNADVIIEAVVEDLAIKQSTFKLVENLAKPEAILATNTSSIPLDEINTVLNQPERLVGLHYFNPVAKMLLVEVVKGKRTSQEVFDKSISFVRQIDKLPLPVKSSPGFLVNRILMPYLLESVEMLNEGIPATAIDKAMVEFGMPMGPISLADTVGLDICLSVAKYLSPHFHTSIPPELVKLVSEHKLGRKTGQGFYKYDRNGQQIRSDQAAHYTKPLTDISDRLVVRMLRESFSCLREAVVADGDLLDAGMIFGAGFAPFLGGPIHYAKMHSIHDLYQQFISQQKEAISST